MNTIEEDIYLLTNSINDAYGIHSQERRAFDRLAAAIRDKEKEIIDSMHREQEDIEGGE